MQNTTDNQTGGRNAARVKQAQIGDLIGVRNLTCRITKILPLGTIECESLNGKHAYRVSGLIGLTAVGLITDENENLI